MANELGHATAGTTLTQAEFEAVGLHVCDSQATGDLIYASSATQLTRLAKGAANTVLVMGASIPAWSATLAGLTLTAPTLNGTITLGSTPIFDAGAGVLQVNTTGAGVGFYVVNTHAGDVGAVLTLYQNSASPANNDAVAAVYGVGEDNTSVTRYYCRWEAQIEDIVTATASGKQVWKNMFNAATNTAMTLSAAGTLWVDENITLDTGQYVGMDATSNVTFSANALNLNVGSGSAQINTTGTLEGLSLVGTGATGGTQVKFQQDDSTPSLDSIIGQLYWRAYDHDGTPARQAFGYIQLIHSNIGDGTEQATYNFYAMDAGTANNLAMTLSGAGVVSPDHSIMFATSQDSAAVADQVSLGGYEISAGHRALAISSEEVVVVAAAGASDRYLPIRVNGVTEKLLLHS